MTEGRLNTLTDTLDIALPKGRLGDKVIRLLGEAGLGAAGLSGESRRLVLESGDGSLRFFWVKPADVPIYVERGAADIGVAGRDVLLELGADVYELMDLGLGRCRMCVAGPEGALGRAGVLRVATKFPAIATRHFQGEGRAIDIIKLNGSIELAPILGLSDVIVDIVETGTTLRENELVVLEEILPISARLIANKAAFRFKHPRVEALTAALAGILGGEKPC